MCQEGAFIIENISFYPDTKLGTELTADADWKRRGLYIGPAFEQLDPNVQEDFEKYLDERGVNESLALFVPDYAEFKEQRVRFPYLNESDLHWTNRAFCPCSFFFLGICAMAR